VPFTTDWRYKRVVLLAFLSVNCPIVGMVGTDQSVFFQSGNYVSVINGPIRVVPATVAVEVAHDKCLGYSEKITVVIKGAIDAANLTTGIILWIFLGPDG
jgi:hypothetical protein